MGTMYAIYTVQVLNPMNPKHSRLYEPTMVCYIVRDDLDVLYVVTSHGHLGGDYEVGRSVDLMLEGDFEYEDTKWNVEIVGIVDFSTGVTYRHKSISFSEQFNGHFPHFVVK